MGKKENKILDLVLTAVSNKGMSPEDAYNVLEKDVNIKIGYWFTVGIAFGLVIPLFIIILAKLFI